MRKESAVRWRREAIPEKGESRGRRGEAMRRSYQREAAGLQRPDLDGGNGNGGRDDSRDLRITKGGRWPLKASQEHRKAVGNDRIDGSRRRRGPWLALLGLAVRVGL